MKFYVAESVFCQPIKSACEMEILSDVLCVWLTTILRMKNVIVSVI